MDATQDRSRVIFGNEVGKRAYESARRSKERTARGVARGCAPVQHVSAADAPVVGESLGVRELVAVDHDEGFDVLADASEHGPQGEKGPVVIGTIRMGFGHYRIAMAMASAAHALGYVPYWLDLMAFPDAACGRIISHQNDLYSLGSRLSQRLPLFNKLIWEPLNSEGFRHISYNSSDQKLAELMTAPFADLPADVPFVGTHAWTAQAACHAGLTQVVNAIPDNWPMALHLAEGSVHTVQTPSSHLGYKMLRGMDGRHVLKPMPAGSLVRTGHYVDHEIVSNVEADCARRRNRLDANGPVRYLLSVGGAGAQFDLFKGIIEHLAPYIMRDEAALMVNVGDHAGVWNQLMHEIPILQRATVHFGDFDDTASFAAQALDGEMHGIHAFYDHDIFAAVYSTNLLMRVCDVLVTKPSELAYYPVPKLMIRRVGGHEAWGAICAAELGDGTYEVDTLPEIAAMIDVFQQDPEILGAMCDNIESEKGRGTYDGAYRVIELATGAADARAFSRFKDDA